jgi:antitoxin ParD1/3/4
MSSRVSNFEICKREDGALTIQTRITLYRVLSTNSFSEVQEMQLVTVKMSDIYVNGLDKLVEIGMYPSRSEAIRVAIRDLLRRELWPENGSPLLKENDSE